MTRGVRFPAALAIAIGVALGGSPAGAQTKPDYLCNDSHFHLTNYVQEGPTVQQFLGVMGDKVGRVALFGIPLQQQWSA